MKTLLILRHAKSSWKKPDLADHDRPLNKRGKQDAPRMGRLLCDEGLMPEVILCSTAKRALDTAVKVADECGYDGEIRPSRDLYSFGPEPYLDAVSRLDDAYERAMIVGHNPGLEELVGAFSGDYERFPTAALAQIKLPIERWGDLDDDTEGKLVNLWRPKEL